MNILMNVPNPARRSFVFHKSEVDAFESSETVKWLNETERLEDVISNYEVVFTTWDSPKLTKDVLKRAENLKLVLHCAGTVVPYIDSEIFNMGIHVSNSNIALAYSTAELAFTHILAGLWKLKKFEKCILNNKWSNPEIEMPNGLYGATVGIVGIGYIAKILIEFLKPFNCNLLFFSHYLTDEQAKELGGKKVSLDELCRESDVITLHNTLTKTSEGMFGKKQFDLMKPGSLFVNTSRGPIVNRDSLLEAIQTKDIYAATDVYTSEPFSPDAPLFASYENAVCTPHIGGYSKKWIDRLFPIALNEFARYKNQEPLKHEITLEEFMRLSPR